MATQEQREAGFKAQTEVCRIMNEMFNQSGLYATETDKITDLTEHYDIAVRDKDNNIIKKFDVKSTMLPVSNGYLAYTYMNICGEKADTSSKTLNKRNVELVFVYGKDFNKIYFVDMNSWYDFIIKQFGRENDRFGRTYVMSRDFKPLYKDDPRKGKQNLFKKYNVRKIVKNMLGEEVEVWVADAFIHNKKHTDIELKRNYEGLWYFENGSRYIRISEEQIAELCKQNGFIINVNRNNKETINM